MLRLAAMRALRVGLVVLLSQGLAFAARHPVTRAPSGLSWTAPGGAAGSAPWGIVVLLTLLPSILLCMTPFVRLLVVFHFLRQALGTQTAPSNQTVIGLSFMLTFFLMQPVMLTIQQNAIAPF